MPKKSQGNNSFKKRKNPPLLPFFIAIGCIIIVILLIVFRAFRVKTTEDVRYIPEPEKNIATIEEMEKEKLRSMLPEGYDREIFEKSWNSFLSALAENRADPNIVKEFMLSLKEAINDKKFDKQEADRLIRLMNEASK